MCKQDRRFRVCAVAALYVLAAAGCVLAQNVDVSGLVVDATGNGLPGATVTLLKVGLSRTTGADGSYSIAEISVLPERTHSQYADPPALRSGGAELELDGQGVHTVVEVFDTRGRRLSRPIDGLLPVGRQVVPLARKSQAEQLWFVRVRMGDRTWVLRGHTHAQDGVVSSASSSPTGLAKGMAGAVDTLHITLPGYVSKRLLVQSYSQYMVTVLDIDDGLSLTINDGSPYVVNDTCVLNVNDRDRVLASVRFTDSVVAGVPQFGVAVRSSPAPSTIADVANAFQWLLQKGAGRKTVYAERSYTAGGVDTVSAYADIRPYQATVTIRNDTAGAGYTMRRLMSDEYLPEQRSRVPTYGLHRPWIDFSVDVDGDDSYAEEIPVSLLFGDNDVRIEYEALETVRRTFPLSAGATHVHRYSFHPDSAQGAENLATLSSFRYRPETGIDTVILEQIDTTPAQNYETLKYLSYNDKRTYGCKEIALAVRLRGKYFDDPRYVILSGRLDWDVPMVLYYDAYPPHVKRDDFEYMFPEDGSVIDSSFSIDLNAVGTIYDDSTGAQFNERGLVWDMGGADVISIELVIAKIPDEIGLGWNPQVTPSLFTATDILSYPHHRFPFPIAAAQQQIYPVRWGPIDPREWNDGWYAVAILTADSFGNAGIAPFSHRAGFGNNSNPQHWRIVTKYHDL